MLKQAFRLFNSEAKTQKKKKLVILGTGWGCKSLIKTVDKSLYDVTVVSPRNHFLFTPLLASTTVGTLEFRSITDPIRRFADFNDQSNFHLAKALTIDAGKKVIQVGCELDRSVQYELNYDVLAITVGARTNTFGIPGVQDNAYFLKQIQHSQAIRKKIIELLELAESSMKTDEEKKQLLNFVVVGGGPTGVEFSAELYDFLQSDVKRMFPRAYKHANVTLIEAGNILGAFDEGLRSYAENIISKRSHMRVVKEMVAEVTSTSVKLRNGDEIPCGMTVWSAGVAPTPFADDMDCIKVGGRILTDDYLRVKGMEQDESVFAFGDCATPEHVTLPATAQVADRQGAFIGKLLNDVSNGVVLNTIDPFTFRSFGMLAYIGDSKALSNLQGAKIKGWLSWLVWRSAYLSQQGSWRLRLQVPVDWLKTSLFGRDTSTFSS